MRLHDDGASGGKRGGCIAAGDGKCEREVAGAENGDGAKRAQHGAKVRARQRLPVGKSRINSRIYPRALFNDCGKHPQLVRGSAYFAQKAWHRQCRLKVRALCQYLAVGFKSVGNAADKGSFGFAACLRVGVKRFGGQAHSSVQFGGSR